MAEEPTHYNKYEVHHLLGLKDEHFNMERIFGVYKQPDSKHFYYNILQAIAFPKIVSSKTFTTYYTNPSDLWTTISYRFYDRINLWWLICVTNKVMNPVVLPEPGLVLKIIKKQYIPDILDDIKALS